MRSQEIVRGLFYEIWAKREFNDKSGIFKWETYLSIPGLSEIIWFSGYKDSRGLKRTQEDLEYWIHWEDPESLGNKEDWIQGFKRTQ